MKLIETDIDLPSLKDLLVECHNFNIEPNQVPQTHNLTKISRCVNMDVKVQLKLILNYDPIDYEEGGHSTPYFQITFKWAVNVDCINLRHNRSFFGDTEFATFTTEIPRELEREEMHTIYTNVARHLIERLEEFKVCCECRTLYTDKRVVEASEMRCMQCYFDRIFFLKDSSCVICKDVFQPGEQTFTLSCGHSFHSSCILRYFITNKKRECPLCREVESI